ncbi:MAG: hypothetical protein AB7K09_19325 [Planctomycetota bacterium]
MSTVPPAAADPGVPARLAALDLRVQRLGWSFLVSHLLFALVAAALVYLAARAGFGQAVRFDDYQSVVHRQRALESVRAELLLNRPLYVNNLRLVRCMLLARTSLQADSRRESLMRIQSDLQRIEQQLQQAREPREQEAARHQMETMQAAQKRMTAEVKDLEMEEQGYRMLLGTDSPEIRRPGSKDYIDEIRLVPAHDTLWTHVAGLPLLHELDAGLVTDLAHHYALARSLGQQMPGQTDWSDLEPTRVRVSSYDARRRELTLTELIEALDTSLLPRIEEQLAQYAAEARRLREAGR